VLRVTVPWSQYHHADRGPQRGSRVGVVDAGGSGCVSLNVRTHRLPPGGTDLITSGTQSFHTVSVATGWRRDIHNRSTCKEIVVNHHPVATTTPRGLPARGPRSAPGSVFVPLQEFCSPSWPGRPGPYQTASVPRFSLADSGLFTCYTFRVANRQGVLDSRRLPLWFKPISGSNVFREAIPPLA
jgi:hypothetical protein